MRRKPPAGLADDAPMCYGASAAWKHGHQDGPHRSGTPYPACWRCLRSLGCSQCAGPTTEVLCVACAAWGTLDAYLTHGPVLNTPTMLARRRGRAPQHSEYPFAWAAAYRSQDRPESNHVGDPATPLQGLAATVAGQLGLPRGHA